jgi:hypothetical protein
MRSDIFFMRYSEVAGPEELDLLGPGMAMLFPIERAEEEHADVDDDGATKASADVLASARAAIAARVVLWGMMFDYSATRIDDSYCPLDWPQSWCWLLECLCGRVWAVWAPCAIESSVR